MQHRSKFSSVRQLFLFALLALVVSQSLLYAFAQVPVLGAISGSAPGVPGNKTGMPPAPAAKGAAGGLLGGLLGGGGKKGQDQGILSIGRGPREQPQTVAEALQQAKVNPENEPGDLKLDLQQLLQADLWLGQDDKPLWHAPQLAKQFAQEQSAEQSIRQSQQQNQTQEEEARRMQVIARLVRLIRKKQGEQEQEGNRFNNNDDNNDDNDDDEQEKRRPLRRELSLRRSERKGKFHNNDDEQDDQDDGEKRRPFLRRKNKKFLNNDDEDDQGKKLHYV